MSEPTIVAIDSALVRYAHDQCEVFKMKLRTYLTWLIALSCYLAFMIVVVVQSGTKVEIDKPRFIGKHEAMLVEPMINRELPRTVLTAYAEEYATKLSSFHFRRYYEQLERLKPLFVPGAFTEHYLNPLLQNNVLDQLAAGDAIITAGVVNTRFLGFYAKDGHSFYDYIVSIVQTRQDLSGEPKTSRARVYLTLMSVNRNIRAEGVQIYKISIQRS